MIEFRLQTEHVNEAGAGVAVAVAGPFALANFPFAAGPVVGVPFAHGGVPDALWQNFTIFINPPAGGGLFLFDFPVTSTTAPIPEPSSLFLLGSGLLPIAYRVLNKFKRPIRCVLKR